MAPDPDKPSQAGTPPDPGYERRDANSKWIFGIVAGLFIAIIASELVLKWINAGLASTPPPTDRWSGAAQRTNTLWSQTNYPRLQLSPPADLALFRAREAVQLSSYGWIDRTTGVVHIPIDHAMDLLLQRGLPVRAGINRSRLGPTPLELQQQRTNSTAPETQSPR